MQHVRPTLGDTSWFVHDRFGMFIVIQLPVRKPDVVVPVIELILK